MDYYNSEYGKNNPDWHIEDSPSKFFQLSSIIPLNKYEHILDVGCGIGFLTRLIANYYMPEKMTGLDISKEAIRRAKEKDIFEQIEWKQGELSSIKEEVDLIVCADLIEHLEEPSTFLKEANKIGKNIAIKVPMEVTLLNQILKLFGKNEMLRLEKKYGHINHYNFHKFSKLIVENGWIIKKAEFYPLPKRTFTFLEILRKISIITMIFFPKMSIKIFGGFALLMCTRKQLTE